MTQKMEYGDDWSAMSGGVGGGGVMSERSDADRSKARLKRREKYNRN